MGRARGTGNYFASPIAGDGKVYLINEKGLLTVLKADGQWEAIADHDLPSEPWPRGRGRRQDLHSHRAGRVLLRSAVGSLHASRRPLSRPRDFRTRAVCAPPTRRSCVMKRRMWTARAKR